MIDFATHPDRYKHWKLTTDGPIARLDLAVDPAHPYGEGYELKLNSYDLGVDIELADAVQRVRFEHPEVKVVVVGSGIERVFCAGANIGMLSQSTHPFKVNFCKYTNETRCSIEDASAHSGIKFVAAVSGPCAGGGYELAIACDEIYLIEDGNSSVSLPEVALLGVLPGTGGLTRLVDKRHIRRDLADIFSTLAEGVRGKRAKQWNLIDDYFPRSKFADKIDERANELAGSLADRGNQGIQLSDIRPRETDDGFEYEHVSVTFDKAGRTATLTIRGPEGQQPATPDEYLAAGDGAWVLRAFRELDNALCQLRFGYADCGLVLLETRGDLDQLLAVEKSLVAHQDHWLIREITLFLARTLRRYELTARSFFAIAGAESCFGGLFLELALAGDRIYALDDPDNPVEMAIGPMANGLLPMANGLTRLQSRFLADPDQAAKLAQEQPRVSSEEANELGLVTVLADDIDWDDEVRIAIEERASLSPDALTGMEASLRFGGAETCDSKIYGRLTAWQNWIFSRPNAVGEEGALVCYGKPETARFDWRRT